MSASFLSSHFSPSVASAPRLRGHKGQAWQRMRSCYSASAAQYVRPARQTRATYDAYAAMWRHSVRYPPCEADLTFPCDLIRCEHSPPHEIPANSHQAPA